MYLVFVSMLTYRLIHHISPHTLKAGPSIFGPFQWSAALAQEQPSGVGRGPGHRTLGVCGVRDRWASLQSSCECWGVRDINLKHNLSLFSPLCSAQMGMCVADHYHDAICSRAAPRWRDAPPGETSAHPKLCNGELNHQRHKLKTKCSVGTEGGCREKGTALDGFG